MDDHEATLNPQVSGSNREGRTIVGSSDLSGELLVRRPFLVSIARHYAHGPVNKVWRQWICSGFYGGPNDNLV